MLKPGAEQEKDLVAVPAGTVEGRVSTGGRPVAGAIVSLEREGDLMMRIGAMLGMASGLVTGVTDRDGRYVIDAVVPEADVRLQVQAVGFASAQTDPFRVASGEQTTRDFELQAARWMTVTVVDADTGEPIANAMVVASMKDAEQAGRGAARIAEMTGRFFTTDAAGHARIGPLSEGVAGVRAQAGGYLQPDDWTWFEAGAREGVVKLRRGLEIRGRIELPPGLPASSVEIEARSTGSGGWQREETAPKADGTFVVAGLKEGVYKVTARASLPGKRFEALLDGVEAGADGVDLVLTEVERGSMLTIKVVDPKGSPVTRARISLQRTWKSGGSSSSSRTLSAGRATFELDDERTPDEVYIEIFQVEGGQAGALYHGPVDYVGGELELTLGPAASIRGRVTAAGKPVGGVQVAAMLVKPGAKSATSREHASAITADDGRYTLEGLGPYDYELRFAPPPQYAPTPSRRARAGATGIDMELEVGATATITVLDDAGGPLAGAHVYANAQGRRDGGRSRPGANVSARTNSRGEATLQGLPPGARFTLGANPPESRKDLRPTTQEGWTPTDTTLRLEPAYGIAGTVVDKSGAPIAGGDVRAKLPDGDERQFSADVDAKGRFRLERLPPGEYEVWYEADGALRSFGPNRPEPATARVRAGASDVILPTDLGLSLTVKIANWSGDNRWQHAQLHQDDGRGSAWTQVGADGVVRFHRLVEGKTYTLAITGLAGGRYVHRSGLRPGDDVTLRIEKGKQVTGRVRIPSAAAGGRVNVTIQGHGWSLGAEADEGGRFTIEGVPEGTWTIRAYARRDDANWSGEAQVSAGGDVEIPLARQR